MMIIVDMDGCMTGEEASVCRKKTVVQKHRRRYQKAPSGSISDSAFFPFAEAGSGLHVRFSFIDNKNVGLISKNVNAVNAFPLKYIQPVFDSKNWNHIYRAANLLNRRRKASDTSLS